MSRNLGGSNSVRSLNSTGRWSPFQAEFGEDDIRRLAGPMAFKQGDAWQRAGHVRYPSYLETGIGAEVLGTWQRADTVTASTSGNRIRTECSCESGEFCRHAAALLLHWLRSPTSFGSGETTADRTMDSFAGEDADGTEDMQNPVAEFAGLLSQDTMTHLRQIARERGAQVTARNKAELIGQLATMLSTEESVNDALTSLDDDARLALAGIELANTEEKRSREAIGNAYRALGGAGKMYQNAPIAAEKLVNQGLVFPTDRYVHPPAGYVMPSAVSGPLADWMRREGRLRRLLRPADSGHEQPAGGEGGPAPRPTGGTFTLLEIIQVIVHEVVGGAIGGQTTTVPRTETAFVPPGWRIDPAQPATAMPATPRGLRNAQPPVHRVTPLPSIITHADLRHLIDLTGGSEVMIEFAIELMLALGILDIIVEPAQRRVQARQDLLETLLSLSPGERLAVMSDTYVNMADAIDLRAMVGPKRPLQLHYRATYYSSVAPYQPQDSAVRRVLALLLAWLAENEERWYDVASLLAFFWSLGPSLLGQSAPHYGEWWFAPSQYPETRLNLDVWEDWERVMKPLVSSLLAGPLTWLGVVDTLDVDGTRPGADPGSPVAFRALPAARLLTGEVHGTDMEQPAEAEPHGGPLPLSPLVFDIDGTDGALTVSVPAGSPDPAIHTLLSAIGELQHISREGLCYQVTAGRLQPVFESGITGPDLINALTSRAGRPLPDAVREILERWWSGYGAIRLYDDVTLIELGDDVLLRELRATSSLDRALVHTFSPRLVAVDGSMVQDLIAELRRLGHTPRVVEEAGRPVSGS